MENEPKQLTDGLLPDWQRTVTDYSVSEWDTARKRAETCGCGSCKGRLAVAEDRMDWELSIGEWSIGKKRQKILKDNENNIPKNTDPDDKQVA